MTKKYQVREGQTFGTHGKYKEGDIVELEEKAASAFPDKLMLVKEAPEPAAVRVFAYLTDKQEKALIEAGFADQAALDAASDEVLLAVTGVGDAAIKLIRDNKVK